MTPAALIRRLILIRPGEGRALLLAWVYYFCILSSYYVMRPLREEIGIRGELDNLPWLWTATTAAMVVAVPLFAWLVSRVPRRVFIPVAYRFFAVNIAVFYAVFWLVPAEYQLAAGYAFYVWLSVFNLFITAIFWGFMADLFTSEQGKRLFGAIGVGGTLGAIAGASVPALLVHQLGTLNLLLVALVLLEGAAQGASWLIRMSRGMARPAIDSMACPSCGYSLVGLPAVRGRAVCPECGAPTTVPARPPREPGRGVWTGIVLVARSPYLLGLAGYMLIYTLTSTFMYFEQARIVKASIADSAARTAFFARVDLLVNLCLLFLQCFVTGRVMTRLGLAFALSLVPIVTAAGFGAMAAAPVLGVYVAVYVTRRALHFAIDRPSREVLYTVLGPDEKYKSKSFIDTFVYRGGDVLGAWTHGLAAAKGLVAVVAVVCAAWWWIGLVLAAMHRHAKAGESAPGAPPAAPGT